MAMWSVNKCWKKCSFSGVVQFLSSIILLLCKDFINKHFALYSRLRGSFFFYLNISINTFIQTIKIVFQACCHPGPIICYDIASDPLMIHNDSETQLSRTTGPIVRIRSLTITRLHFVVIVIKIINIIAFKVIIIIFGRKNHNTLHCIPYPNLVKSPSAWLGFEQLEWAAEWVGGVVVGRAGGNRGECGWATTS